MAPPGRRRSAASYLFSVPFLLLSLAQLAQAQSVVLGLDVGTEYIKAALVKPGVPLDIVLTKDSKRKEAAAIGFKPVRDAAAGELPERLYGSDALAVASRFPADIYPNIKPLLGSLQDTIGDAASYKQRFPGLEQAIVGNALGLKNSFDDRPFAVEELLAMEFGSVKANAQVMAGAGLTVRNAVITIPAFFTVDERRAIEHAAKLAGLNPMALVSDGLAVGLNYATTRNFPNIDKSEKAEHHLIYDMGAGSTTATVLKFQARAIKDVGRLNKTIQEVNVLGVGWDRSLGGDLLNQLIVNDMVEQFVASSGAKSAGVTADAVKKHGRTMAKLWREAERLRQVLSANSATSGNFESLFEDVDFKYKLARADFEAMAEAYGARINPPIQTALDAAGLTTDDLDSVVLHGGMVRTPFVQKALEATVKDAAKLRNNVNADEAAVFGAAFRAAGLSPSFKVKDIKANDIAVYGATLRWTAKGKPRSQNVFVSGSQAGVVKQMPFNASDDFSVSLVQHVPTPAGTLEERGIGEFVVANLTASVAELVAKHGCAKDEISTVLSIRLDPLTGVPEVSAGASSCETGAAKGSVMDGVKGLLGLGDKKEQEPLQGDEGETTETISEPSSAASPGSSATPSGSEMDKKAAKSSASAAAKPKKKTQTITLNIAVTRTDSKAKTEDEFAAQRERLKAFDQSDRARRQREEAFNTLEAFLYRAADIVADAAFVAVSTPQQRAQIEALAAETSEWLHGAAGSAAPTEAITEKYTALTALIDPVQERKDEEKKRPRAVESLQKTLKQTEDLVAKMRDAIDAAAAAASSTGADAADAAEEALEDLEDAAAAAATTPSASAIYSEEDYERVQQAAESARDWLATQLAEQGALAASDEPALRHGEVNTVTKQLNELLAHMLGKEKMAKQQASSSSSSARKAARKTSSSAAAASKASASSAASPSSSSGSGASKSTTVLAAESSAAPGDEAGSESHPEL